MTPLQVANSDLQVQKSGIKVANSRQQLANSNLQVANLGMSYLLINVTKTIDACPNHPGGSFSRNREGNAKDIAGRRGMSRRGCGYRGVLLWYGG